MTLLRIHVQRAHQSEQKFQVSCHQKYQLKKDTEQLEVREEFIMYFCVCLMDITVLKIFPRLSFNFFIKLFFLYLTFFPVFDISWYMGSLVIYSLITIILIIFKLCSSVECVFLFLFFFFFFDDDVDDAVCCSMYVPCLWFGFITWRFSKRNSC